MRVASLIFLILAAALPGCVSSKTFVLEPVPSGSMFGRIALKPAEATITVDPKAQADFHGKLSDQLKKFVGVELTDPPDILVQYRFVLFEQGSGATRIVSGLTNVAGSPIYGLGDGSIGVEVIYLKPDGTRVGHIISDGPITGAFGTTGSALDAAAVSVAKYTKANFTCPTCGHVGPVNPQPRPMEGLKTALN